jgi:hypothetical protein
MRKTPYTARGIQRKKCFRCGKKAETQWQICADDNIYRPLCRECDTELNIAVLRFMGFQTITLQWMINNYLVKQGWNRKELQE